MAWSERLQILIELPLFIVSLLLFGWLAGRGQQIATGHVDWQFDPAHMSSLSVGYTAFLFFYLQTAKLFWRLLGEIQAGTLEQVSLSPLPAWMAGLGRFSPIGQGVIALRAVLIDGQGTFPVGGDGT